MTTDDKISAIASFENDAGAFDDVFNLPSDLLTDRPFPDAWTIHEHVVHCLEVDAANFHRYRRAIAQPDTPVLSFDQSWTASLDYHRHDLAASVALIKSLRKFMAAHLRTLADRDWRSFAYMHSKYGRIDLEYAVQGYIDHVRFHRELIDRNIDLWNQAEKQMHDPPPQS
jgi:hypothetical protein